MKLLVVIGVAWLATTVYGQAQNAPPGTTLVRPDQLEGLGVGDTPTTRVIGGRRFAVVPVTGQAARRRQTTTTTTTSASRAGSARTQGIPAAPLRAETDEELGPPIPYAFNFAADGEDGGSHTREESRDASGTVTGSYTVTDPDGRSRTVRYIADANGFRAEVETNEIGTENSEPAQVVINSRAPTPAQLVAEFEAERQRSPLPAERTRTRTTTTRRRVAAAAQPAPLEDNAASASRVVVLNADQLQGAGAENIVRLLRSGRARLVTRN